MQANPSKFQSLYLNRNATENVSFNLDGNVVCSEQSVKLLGMHVDKNLTFEYQINEICKKAARQINALQRLSTYLNTESKMKIFNSFIQSNFQYCSVLYSHCSNKLIKKMEKLQERALRFVFNDFDSPYPQLLDKASKPSLITSRIKQTAEQVFKIKNGLAPPIPATYFEEQHVIYNLRNSHTYRLPAYNTIKYGKNSFRYRGQKHGANYLSI